MMERNALARYILLAELILIFGYFGIDKFIHPLIWIGWMPSWMDGLLGMSKNTWLQIVGAGEITMAVLLVVPVRLVRQIGATLVVLEVMGVLTQVGFNDMGARDLGIFLSALALLALL